MSIYRYEAVDRAGKVVRGAMKAADEQQVARKLTQMGYSPRAIHGASAGSAPRSPAGVAPAAATGPRVSGPSGVPVSVQPSVPLFALAAFFRHLATLVRSGMPLSQALVEMQGVVRNRTLRSALGQMMESTSAGNSLSGLMTQYPSVFPVHTVASVWAGELGGKLEIALGEVASDLESEAADTRYGRIGWMLTKLSVIALILVYPLADVGSLLAPVFQRLMDSPGELDKYAGLRMLGQQYVSRMLVPSLAVCALVILVWVLWGHVKRVPAVRRMLDGALLHVPVWGPLHRARGLARFFHVLDQLYAAGVGTERAWDAASLVPRNSAMAEKLRLARAQLGQNPRVSDLLHVSGMASAEDAGLAASGEKSGQLPDVLANLSAHYENEAATLRTKARAAGIFALTMFSILGTGYIAIRLVATYADLPFKLVEMMGVP